MDTPLQRSLKIGRAVIGLLGLDIAMGQALAADSSRPRDEVLEKLYQRIAADNYIPPGREELYRQALAREYQRLLEGGDTRNEVPEIRILGPGCVSCNRLQELVFEVMTEMKAAADILQVHDPDEIGRFGLNRTPALVINGEVVCAGRLPSRAEVEQWLKNSAPSPEQSKTAAPQA